MANLLELHFLWTAFASSNNDISSLFITGTQHTTFVTASTEVWQLCRTQSKPNSVKKNRRKKYRHRTRKCCKPPHTTDIHYLATINDHTDATGWPSPLTSLSNLYTPNHRKQEIAHCSQTCMKISDILCLINYDLSDKSDHYYMPAYVKINVFTGALSTVLEKRKSKVEELLKWQVLIGLTVVSPPE